MKAGFWDYVGDEGVGVITDCDCPEEEIGQFPNGETIFIAPHESHDVVKPLFESALPEGVTMETWRRWMKLIAAAPDLLAACEKTLEENGHLADGENCTLTHLKRVVTKIKGGDR